MDTSELEQRIFAYFLLTQASNVNIDGRFRRREEFIQTFEDVFFYSTQKFAGSAAGRHSNIAAKFVAQLIETGSLSASHDKWSGTSYQFNASRYAAFIKEQIDGNISCQHARQIGPEYWDEVFRQA